MPDTGYSPYGGWDTGSPIDNSGGGIDPSYASSLAAGGDFPGARQNLLGYLAGASTGANLGNPDYQVPSWLSWLAGHAGASGSLARNVAGRLVSGHEANVRSPGGGQEPGGLSGGYPYNFFSGPGASYGPANGPGTGLVDMGRGVASEWDGPESKPPGDSTSTPAGGGKGKGGHGGGHALNWTPYQGITHQPSFVDWQPINPGTPGPYPATRFVGGGGLGQGAPTAPPITAPGVGGRGHGGGGLGGGGGAGHGGGGTGNGPAGGRNPAGSGHGPGPGSGNVNTNGGSGFGLGDPWSPGNSPVAPHVGQQLRENTRGGVDTNYLDYMTPGWLRDPTAGTTNTSGFPSATLPSPNHGENFDEYMTRLHDSGFSSDDIFSMLGGGYGFTPNGGNEGPFRPGDPNAGSDWGWGWGTGPPTRGEYGYDFAANSHDSGLDMPEGSGYSPTAGLADGPAYVMRDGHRIRVDFGAPTEAGGAGEGRSGGMSGGRSGVATPAEVAQANATMSALMRPLY